MAVAVFPLFAAERRPPSPPDLLVVGLDGADLVTLDRFLAEGRKLPNLRRLLTGGFSVPVTSFEPTLSPLLWTTIATGRTPADHGVWDFLESGPDGDPIPATSAGRRVRAFWNVAAENDLSVAVLGWYASWPAERVRGAIVSDRIVGRHDEPGGGSNEGLTFPADLASTLEPLRPSADEARREASRCLLAAPPPPGSEARVDGLARSWRSAELTRRSFGVVLDRFSPRIAAIYLDLPDAAGHLVADLVPPASPAASPAEVAAFGESWAKSWEEVDRIVGSLLERGGASTRVLVCSDHGFKDGADRPRRDPRIAGGFAPIWHRREGLAILHGAGIRKGIRQKQPVSIDDLFPTLALLGGLPLSDELPGRPIVAAFDSPPPSRRVASYELRPRRIPPIPRIGAGERRENLARLRALGYLAGGELPAAKPGARTARSLLNEGLWRIGRGEAETAAARLRDALDADPRLDEARLALSSALAYQGDLDGASEALAAVSSAAETLPLLLARGTLALERGRVDEGCARAEEAKSIDDRFPGLWLLEARCAAARGRHEESIELAARVIGGADSRIDADAARRLRAEGLEALGRRSEAIAELLDGLGRDPSPAGFLLLGDLRSREGKGGEALEAWDRGGALDPRSPWPHLRAGLLLLTNGRNDEARGRYRLAFERARSGRGRELARLGLALVAAATGDSASARRELEAGLEENPRSAPLHEQLGSLLARDRKWAKAADHLLLAARLAPTPRLWALSAAVLQAAGRGAEAVDAAKRSLELDPEQPELRRLVGLPASVP